MATEVKLRRGTTAQCDAMTPAAGEVIVDTTLKQLRVGDATTAGGNKVATAANPILTGLVDLSSASSGQVKFPASQNASSDVNTLDDYEEGTFTPAITFATAGDLSVAYTRQRGNYTKIGNHVTAVICITTSSFTHTTASGTLQITGFPFAPSLGSGSSALGATSWRGITKAGFTDINGRLDTGTTTGNLIANASATTPALVAAADMPTGGTVDLYITIPYVAAT